MELEGRYIGFWMTDEAMVLTLGIRTGYAPPKEPWWLCIGKIEGETPGVGLWVNVEEVEAAATERKIPLKAGPELLLVRWEAITGAILWDERPAEPRRFIGFNPGRALEGEP